MARKTAKRVGEGITSRTAARRLFGAVVVPNRVLNAVLNRPWSANLQSVPCNVAIKGQKAADVLSSPRAVKGVELSSPVVDCTRKMDRVRRPHVLERVLLLRAFLVRPLM